MIGLSDSREYSDEVFDEVFDRTLCGMIKADICHQVLKAGKCDEQGSCNICHTKFLKAMLGYFGLETKESDNPYWDSICKIAEQQRQKGLKEYEQGLEDNTELSTDERIKMVEEEMVDALMYLEHLRKGREED